MLSEVKSFRKQVVERGVRLKRARAAQQQVVAQRAEQRRSIEGQLAERQRLLSSIKDQIASLEAAERRRQAQAAAAARARLAAASLQRQTESTAQPEEAAPVLDVATPIEDALEAYAAPPAVHGGVVGIAMQYLGVPYVYGGASPSGFDCSGLIMYAYSQIGVSLPHHAASQYGMGSPVSRDQLAAGRPRLLQRPRPRGHLHRRRPVHPRAAHGRRRQDLEPLRLLVREYLRRRPRGF